MRRHFIRAMGVAVLIGSFALASQAVAQQKTTKECNAEWSAKKAAQQTNGQKKKDFVAACLGTASSAAPSQGSATPAAAAPAAKAAKTQTATGAGQFTTEAQAKSHCPTGTVVWANLNSKVYHYSGARSYGKTKRGAYMCEADASSGGFHAAKGEKHP